MTGVGYPDETEIMARYWPADVHLIGKDIVRFHAVYWPAFLMSAGICRCPNRCSATASCSRAARKCRRSLGNVVDPMELAERSGSTRCAISCCAKSRFGQDGSYSAEAIVNRVNAELANSFGNLAQRSLSMIFKNLDGVLPAAGEADGRPGAARPGRAGLRRAGGASSSRFAFSAGLEAWMARGVRLQRLCRRHGALGAYARPIPSGWRRCSARWSSAVRKLAEAVAPVIPGFGRKAARH